MEMTATKEAVYIHKSPETGGMAHTIQGRMGNTSVSGQAESRDTERGPKTIWDHSGMGRGR